MNPPNRTNLDDVSPAFSPAELLMMLLAVGGGAFAAAMVLPMWLPALTDSLLGDQPKAFWYMARASGFIAFLMMWLSVALGLIVTNKLARLWNTGPTAVDLHQFTTWLAVALTIFHALILLGDRFIQSSPAQVLVPFTYIKYRPEWVGVGQVALYLTLMVAVSFYFRKQLGYRAWRMLHYSSFVIYVLITVHGIFSGTDTPALLGVYLALGIATYFLMMYRMVMSIRVRPSAAGHAPTKTRAADAAPAAMARPVAPVRSTPAPPAE